VTQIDQIERETTYVRRAVIGDYPRSLSPGGRGPRVPEFLGFFRTCLQPLT